MIFFYSLEYFYNLLFVYLFFLVGDGPNGSHNFLCRVSWSVVIHSCVSHCGFRPTLVDGLQGLRSTQWSFKESVQTMLLLNHGSQWWSLLGCLLSLITAFGKVNKTDVCHLLQISCPGADTWLLEWICFYSGICCICADVITWSMLCVSSSWSWTGYTQVIIHQFINFVLSLCWRGRGEMERREEREREEISLFLLSFFVFLFQLFTLPCFPPFVDFLLG